MLTEALKRLEATPDNPAPIVAQLNAYRNLTLKAFNSYTHGSIHPLSRYVTGYPPQLVYDTLCNSNGLLMMTTQLVCMLTGAPENQIQWRKLLD